MKALKFIIEANKQQVRRLLNWTELQYGEYVQKKGIEYLTDVVGSDDWAVQQLTKGELFWSWWKNHWYKRDEVFLIEAEKFSLIHRRIRYDGLHTITAGLYPHRAIMEQSYALLMDRMNVEAVKEVNCPGVLQEIFSEGV